jgi:hypothetical protein
MSVRLFLLIAGIGVLLGGCVTTSGGDDLERMQRNQRSAMETTA